jgi:hypothetical protein
VAVDRCAECSFDGDRWTDQDVLTTLGALSRLWAGHLEGARDAILHTRPDAETWSIAEYTHHLGDTLWAMRFLADTARATTGSDLGEVHGSSGIEEEPSAVDLAAAIERLADESMQLRAALAAVPTERWGDASVRLNGDEVDLGWVGRHALHDTVHHLHDVGRIRARLGDGVPHQQGTVAHLAVSDGGVPKRSVDVFDVDHHGAVGDQQGDRKHHGRPFQALCLWSTEQIDALRAEGHPIAPGAAGENITVSGLDWPSLRPGTIVRIGDVVGELSSHATPCAKNAQWFVDGRFTRIDHDEHPGWSRLYASVLVPGRVTIGDVVEVEPQD